MNRFTIAYLYPVFFCCLLSIICIHQLYSQEQFVEQSLESLLHNNISRDDSTDKMQAKSEEKLFDLDIKGENLSSIIVKIAQDNNTNIVLPQGNAAIKEKITYTSAFPLTATQEWEWLLTILDSTDYIMSEKDGYWQVLKRTNDTLREPMPIYINVVPQQLPSSNGVIRYLFYFANLKVSNENDHEVNVLLKKFLSPDALFTVDPITNSVLIIDRANKIKDIMSIICELDQQTFQEKMESIILRHVDASYVETLLNDNLLRNFGDNSRYNLDGKKQTESSFFARGTKVMALPDSNALIIIGREQAVDRLIEFIKEYIDIAPESGQSILHVHQLQYLDAEEFAGVLENIVNSSVDQTSGQSVSSEKGVKGTERFFGEVIIRVDKPKTSDELKYYGGNKLIIAARHDDWVQIKSLIEQLDTPQTQVLLEVLVVDLSLSDTRALGSLLRNPSKIPLPNGVAFQSAQLNPGVVVDNSANPTTIAGDVLRVAFDANGVPTDSGATTTVASFADPGSTLISCSDNNGQTWNITQILSVCTNSKVLSHPHVIATNNQKALVLSGVERLLPDETNESAGGTAVQKYKKIQAKLQVSITPRISSDDVVSLNVAIDINDFIPNSNAQTTRNVVTCANIKSGQAFALGGLITVANTQSSNKLPGIADIPGFGYLFKKRQGTIIKNNLTVFISPTIIQPRLRHGMGEYTKDYIEIAKLYAHEGALFDTLRDPINRWFFNPDISNVDAEQTLEDFVQKDETIPHNSQPPVPLHVAQVAPPKKLRPTKRKNRRAPCPKKPALKTETLDEQPVVLAHTCSHSKICTPCQPLHELSIQGA